MTVGAALLGLVGLLPVLSFLAALLYLDSYKLVKLRAVVAVVACGAAVAGASYFVNAGLMSATEIDFRAFTRRIIRVGHQAHGVDREHRATVAGNDHMPALHRGDRLKRLHSRGVAHRRQRESPALGAEAVFADEQSSRYVDL